MNILLQAVLGTNENTMNISKQNISVVFVFTLSHGGVCVCVCGLRWVNVWKNALWTLFPALVVSDSPIWL